MPDLDKAIKRILNICKQIVKKNIVAILLGILGTALIFVSTSKYGVGLSPDSTNYISAARSLLSGNGYLCWDGSVFVKWPPLFPSLIAVLGTVGIKPLIGVKLLNAFAFGLIIFVSSQLFLKYVNSNVLGILGVGSILLSPPLYSSSVMALSETVFALLVMLFIIYLDKFFTEQNWAGIVRIGILAVLAVLQRYIGITVFMTGFILIIFYKRGFSLKQRFQYVAVFSII